MSKQKYKYHTFFFYFSSIPVGVPFYLSRDGKSSPVTQFTASGLVGIKAENEFSACLACLLLVMRFSGLCDHAERKSVLYKLFVEPTFIDHFKEILLLCNQHTQRMFFSHTQNHTNIHREASEPEFAYISAQTRGGNPGGWQPEACGGGMRGMRGCRGR